MQYASQFIEAFDDVQILYQKWQLQRQETIFFDSLLFHFFFLIITCSCPYSCNVMLTATYMCRPYIY
jgi:hypothetical protein